MAEESITLMKEANPFNFFRLLSEEVGILFFHLTTVCSLLRTRNSSNLKIFGND